MEILISIGSRLLEERERMGKTQSDFAVIAAAAGVPGATRQSQAKYEKGIAAPSAPYMAALALAGADVLYILTGQRSGSVSSALSAEEQTMLGYFREASKEVRRAALGALLGASPSQAGGMNNSGTGAVQIGNATGKAQVFNAPVTGGVAGRNIINKGKK